MGELCFGIDLGTTNSAIALMSGLGNQVPMIITMEDGRHTLPSCVMYDHGKVIVGYKAYSERYKVEQVVYSVKRLMGTDKLIHINDGDSEFDVTPVQVSAEILKELRRQAEKVYGVGNVNTVTVTVPAYFNIKQRVCTQEAVELAGMKLKSIINEPTSAALAYGLYKSEVNEHVLVYDLGGGTFDVTLLEVVSDTSIDLPLLNFHKSANSDTGKTIRIISNSGDTLLGGDDLDAYVYNTAMQNFVEYFRSQAKDNEDFTADCISPEEREELKLCIEQHKKACIADTISMPIHFSYKGKDYKNFVTVNYEMFKQGFEPIYSKTKTCIRDCLLSTVDRAFSKIILNGGSTKLARLKESLNSDFPNVEIYDTLNPDESVALGAAVQTSILVGESQMHVFDVTPLPVGIEAKTVLGDVDMGERFQPVINKGALLPASAIIDVTNDKDNADAIVVPVYQGTSKYCQDNIFLGSLYLDGIPKRKAGEVNIKVEMKIDLNGILTVSVIQGDLRVEKQLHNILKKDESRAASTFFERKLNKYRRMIKQSNLPDAEKKKLFDLVDDFEITKKESSELKDAVKRLGTQFVSQIKASQTSIFSTFGVSETTADDDEESEEEEE
jgi:molecular chaperone DnaK